MLNVPEAMWDTWEAASFVGVDKPVTRALISKRVLKSDGDSPWRMLHFAQNPESVEIPNIKTVEIDRRLGADAATMTMTILNNEGATLMDPLDENYLGGTESPTRRELKDLGNPGVFTFRRGIAVDDSGVNRWQHDVSGLWVDMFIPNRVIYTFQGYGSDGAGQPWNDANLVLTGIWLIDTVNYGSGGTISIACRDAAKLLIEQRLYPPIIPIDNYPLEFCADSIDVSVFQADDIVTSTTTGVAESIGPNVATKKTSGYLSSVTPWYPATNSVYGHTYADAFDGNESTYWLSVGNSGPNKVWSFEWLGANTRGEPINQVRFKQRGGGYKVYVGVKVNGVWQGSSTVPYGVNSKPAYPNGSNIRYVKSVNTPRNNNWITIDLPSTYNAQEVRLVFTNLWNSGLGTYPYRAAVYEMEVSHFQPSTVETITTTETPDPVDIETFVPGNVDDYVDIVKLFCAWSGFFWPNAANPDPLLNEWFDGSAGRVWGDFFKSGAFPVEPPCIPPSYWDNKSVQDGINQIKEILGFIFYIDTGGGAVFRPPNIWKTGNFVQGKGYIGYDSLRTVDETKVLVDYGVSIDDANLRSEIIAVSADDPSVYGVYEPGWAPGETAPSTTSSDAGGEQTSNYDISDSALLGGQQRPMLVPDYPFGKADDPQAQAAVEKFAYLTSLWIHWSYRKSSFRIPGMPAFEPDDQVRIYERTTSEVYVHYIQGLRSVMDVDQGTWWMDIDTHWLGNGPDSTWLINSKEMHPALFAFLRAIGQIPEEVENDESRYPDGWEDYPTPEVGGEYPRIEDDYEDLFPLPADVTWPSPNIDFESDGDYNDYITPPTGGGGSGGSGGGGGTGGNVLACSNTFMFQNWSPGGPRNAKPSQGGGCTGYKIITYTFLTPSDHAAQTETIRIRIDSRGAGVWNALARIISVANYRAKDGQVGSYSCRGIKNNTNPDKWSNHSWGTAVDINYSDNRIGTRIGPSNPLYQIGLDAENKIRTRVGQKRVIVWGNHWSYADPMHFQICATPAELSGGVIILGDSTFNSGPF